MKSFVTLATASTIALSSLTVMAAHDTKQQRAQTKAQAVRVKAKSADAVTRDRCGLPDHSRPTSSLDLSKACDQEELWRQILERNGNDGP